MLVLISLSPGGLPLADDGRIATETSRLEKIREQIKTVLSTLKSKQDERGGLENQLRKTEKALGARNRKIRELGRKIKAARKELRALEVQQSSLNKQLSGHKQKLAAQLRSAYFAGNQEQLKLLLNQQDPSALARVLKYYEYLSNARVKTIEETQTILEDLDQVAASIRKETTRLESLKQEQEQERRVYADERKQRQALLARINSQISEHQDKVDVLRADERRIRELLASLSGVFADIPVDTENLQSFSTKKGRLPWPAKGRFLNHYGQPRASGDLIWQGIRISANPGSDVRAVSHGRVAFADWLPGFGLILIIDHNQGYMSLYGHNEALYKETGDWVNAGDIIASVGDTGGEAQAVLYFEIRHQGKPVDPSVWCRSQAG